MQMLDFFLLLLEILQYLIRPHHDNRLWEEDILHNQIQLTPEKQFAG